MAIAAMAKDKLADGSDRFKRAACEKAFSGGVITRTMHMSKDMAMMMTASGVLILQSDMHGYLRIACYLLRRRIQIMKCNN